MRRSLLIATVLSFIPALASAANMPCARGGEAEALGLRALQSEMMVGALQCKGNRGYNAVIKKFQPVFSESSKDLQAYFRRTKAAGGTDSFITKIANETALRAGRDGSFCRKVDGLYSKTLDMNEKEFRQFMARDEYLDLAHVSECR